MEERHAQIRERAGLEESRLNFEFIDWLRKWGSHLLVLAAVAAAGYWAYQRYERMQADKADTAFRELAAATEGGDFSPDLLIKVADTYEGVGSVSALARMAAADGYLNGVRLGVRPGATLDNDGNLKSPDDALSEADRKAYLEHAQELYQRVFDTVKADPSKMVIRVGALSGLAAVAECRAEFDKAKGYYQQIIDATKEGTFKALAEVAQKRIESLSTLADATNFPAKAQLPKVPKELDDLLNPPPPPAPAPMTSGPGAAPAAGAPTAPAAAPGATPPAATPGTTPGGTPGAQTPAPTPPTATPPAPGETAPQPK